MSGVVSDVVWAVTTGAAGAVVSTITGSGVAGLVNPAGLVSVTLRLLVPSGNAVVGVMLQLPSAATTAVPMTLPAGSLMVTVSPAVPVPLSVGVLSLVVLSSSLPLSLVGSSLAVGAPGATAALSMVMGSVVAGLTLPVGSVAVTLSGLLPSGSGVVGVMDQVPSGATMALPMTAPAASLTVMTLPGVPAPLRVGVVSVVLLSPCVPLSLVGSSLALGATGATVSMTTVMTSGVSLVLPAGSVAVTLRALMPSGSAVVGVAAQVPLAATVAVAMTTPLASLTVMRSPGSPLPDRVGVLSLVVLSPRVPVSLTGSSKAVRPTGAVVSMVTGSVVAGLVLPTGSVAVMDRLLAPSDSGVVGVMAQEPSGATTAVPMTAPCGFLRVMVSPGVAPPPLMVGVVSLVVLSPSLPLSLSGSSTAAGAAGALGSMTTVTVSGLVRVLPAGSVALTLRALEPLASAVVGVTDQVPLAATMAVPMTAPAASVMAMVSPGVPKPLSVGVVSLVVLSPRVPLSLVGSSAAVSAPVPVLAGAVVSMVTGSGVGALVLPAGSVAVTLSALVPSGSGVVGVMDQVPSAATTAVPMTLPCRSLMVMVSPGVALAPDSVGVVSLVVLSSSLPLSLVGSRMAAGAAGAVVSTVTGSGPKGPTLPAGSVALICKALGPSASGVVGVMRHWPAASTMAVPMTVPLASLMVMRSPKLPVPDSTGVLSLVVASPSLPLSLVGSSAPAGAGGAMLSTVMGMLVAGLLTLPTVAVTLSALMPSGRAVVGVADQSPEASTMALAMTVPSLSLIAISAPGVPVPLSMGMLSVVMPSPCVPVSVTASRLTTGMVSLTLKVAGSVATLPAASVKVAVTG